MKIKKGAESMIKLLTTEELAKQIKTSEAKIASMNAQLQELKSSPCWCPCCPFSAFDPLLTFSLNTLAAIRRALKIKRHKRLDIGVPGLKRDLSIRHLEKDASEMAHLKRSHSGGPRKLNDLKPEYGPQITGYIANIAKSTSPQVRLDILAKFAHLLKNKFDVNAVKPIAEILVP